MNKLLDTISRFYQCDLSTVYKEGRHIIHGKNGIELQSLLAQTEQRGPVEASIVRVDQLSDRLAYVYTEYSIQNAHHSEIIGLIQTSETWKAICILGSIQPHRFSNLYPGECSRQTIELNLIEQILFQYCHDVYTMDASDCLSLFWPDARMYHPNSDQTFSDVPIHVLHERWLNAPNPVSLGISEFSRICHIEMIDSHAAIAKIGCAKMDNYYYDYLSLMKIENNWKIVNKMTHLLHVGNL